MDKMATDVKLSTQELIRGTGCSSAFLIDLVRETDSRKAFIRPTYPAKTAETRSDYWSFGDSVKVGALWALRRVDVNRSFFSFVLEQLKRLERMNFITEFDPFLPNLTHRGIYSDPWKNYHPFPRKHDEIVPPPVTYSVGIDAYDRGYRVFAGYSVLHSKPIPVTKADTLGQKSLGDKNHYLQMFVRKSGKNFVENLDIGQFFNPVDSTISSVKVNLLRINLHLQRELGLI